jgi:hypothetical protein
MRRAALAACLAFAASPAVALPAGGPGVGLPLAARQVPGGPLAADPAPAPAPAAADPEPGVAVTVYSAPGGYDPNNVPNVYDPMTGQWTPRIPGFSIIKERRRIALLPGRNAIRFVDVAAKIDGSTVSFKSLTDPAGTSVLEQSFEYDLASADRILEKHVGQPIRVVLVQQGGTYDGRLVSFDHGQIVLQGDDGLRSVSRGTVQSIGYPKLPEGLVVQPTLAWAVQAAKAGDHLAEVAYETSGMSWAADYTAIVGADEKTLDLSAWVTIRNQSGATYKDAGLKLVAGDLNRAVQPGMQMNRWAAAGAKMAMEDSSAGFSEKAFFEYHLYTLGRKTTLPDRSLKQIELFDPVTGVPCRKTYLYDGLRDQPWWGGGVNQDQSFGATGSRKVGVYMEIDNRKENGMGMPLPAGRMRIHKRDEADGFPELVGEDRIDHTPKDEKVRLKVGDAFDVVGERKQTDFAIDHGARWMRETVEIKVRNHKAEPVEVLVSERMYRWVNWEVTQKSHEFVKKDAQLIHFPLKVAKDGEVVLTYTVKYTW